MAESNSAAKMVQLLELLLQGQQDLASRLDVIEEQLYKLDEIDSNQREIQSEVDTLSKTTERTHRYLRQLSKQLDNNSLKRPRRSTSTLNLLGLIYRELANQNFIAENSRDVSTFDSDDSEATVQDEPSGNKDRYRNSHRRHVHVDIEASYTNQMPAKYDNNLSHQNIPRDNLVPTPDPVRKSPSPVPAAMTTPNIPVKVSPSAPSVPQSSHQPVNTPVPRQSVNNLSLPPKPHGPPSTPHSTRQTNGQQLLSQLSTDSDDRSIRVDFTSPEAYLKSLDIHVTDQNMISAVNSVFTDEGPEPSMANIPGLRTVILLDTSSSVNEEMMAGAKRFIGNFVDEVENSASYYNLEESMAVAQFGGKCAILQGFTNDYEPLKYATDNMVRGGKSPLLIGLVMVTAYLHKYGRSVDIGGRKLSPRIVVITDGMVTNHDNVGTEQDVESNSIRCKSKVLEFLNVPVQLGFTVSCVGIGEYDKNFLTNISQTQCRGRFYDGHEMENAQLLGRYYRYQKSLTRIELEMSGSSGTEDILTIVNNATREDSSLADIDREEIIKLCKSLLNLKIPNVPPPSKPSPHGQPRSQPHDQPRSQPNIPRRPDAVPAGPSGRPDTSPALKEAVSEIRPSDDVEPPSLGGWESDDDNPEIRGVDLQQCGRTMQYGIRVRRGDNLPPGSHDDDNVGTVVAHRAEGRVVVKWDSRQFGTFDQNHLTKISEYRKLGPAEDIEVGCKVKRGVDWCRGDEDGGANTEGVVLRKHRDKTVTVLWPSTIIERYGFGKDDKFELEVVTEQQAMANANGEFPVNESSDETVVAWQWKDDQNQWRTLPEEESTKIQKHIDDGKHGTIIVKHFGIQLRCDPTRLKFKEMGGRDRAGEMRRYDATANEVATLRFIEQDVFA
ncbi:hypothetical protein FSP39_019223 [Pinctada imbricata]|uniref:VWFA domain-containing protein n=1 Tax=Pinctada imbricata TaxID=66713 RepID=A0AA88YAJ0_PINIB|nr:hypothetical protein FSP39_019223 [Pinctada imbricata]